MIAFVYVLHSEWLEKRFDLEHKILQFMNKSHRSELIILQGSPVISEWM